MRKLESVMINGGVNPVEQRAYPISSMYNFYIYGEIVSDIGSYVDMITVMDTAEENDVINLYINTGGGSLESTISIVHAMIRSKAQIVCHADGQIASAGTLIFFAGSSFVVYPFAHAMFHDGSTIIGGKFSENLKAAEATSALIKKICMELYRPYFTKKEVKDILNGKDMYLTSDELNDRLIAGVEISKKEAEELKGLEELIS
jgi:ATP-dependent protease ClpP protease subunit